MNAFLLGAQVFKVWRCYGTILWQGWLTFKAIDLIRKAIQDVQLAELYLLTPPGLLLGAIGEILPLSPLFKNS